VANLSSSKSCNLAPLSLMQSEPAIRCYEMPDKSVSGYLFQGLLTANTHPHEEMASALRNIASRSGLEVCPALETTWRDREAYRGPHFRRGSFKADRPRFRAI